MKVKPEHFRLAYRVASIKSSCSSVKNFWASVLRLVCTGENRKLTLLTTDNSIWIEWNIPYEGDPLEFDVLTPEERFGRAARIDGASLELEIHPGVIRLVKPGYFFPLPLENSQTYPVPTPGEEPPHTWRMSAKPLIESLQFLIPLVDETNANKHKSVVTLYTSGEGWTGNIRNVGTVEGITGIERDMSFTKTVAKALVDFLCQGSGDIEVTVDNRTYAFRDVMHDHRIVVLAQHEARYPPQQRVISDYCEESVIDRESFLDKAANFAGVAPNGQDFLMLTFKGEEATAAVGVRTPGDDEIQVAGAEFGIYRIIPPQGESESPEDYELRKGPKKFALHRERLEDTLQSMRGTTVNVQVFRRAAVIWDQIDSGETASLRFRTTMGAILRRRDVEDGRTEASTEEGGESGDNQAQPSEPGASDSPGEDTVPDPPASSE